MGVTEGTLKRRPKRSDTNAVPEYRIGNGFQIHSLRILGSFPFYGITLVLPGNMICWPNDQVWGWWMRNFFVSIQFHLSRDAYCYPRCQVICCVSTLSRFPASALSYLKKSLCHITFLPISLKNNLSRCPILQVLVFATQLTKTIHLPSFYLGNMYISAENTGKRKQTWVVMVTLSEGDYTAHTGWHSGIWTAACPQGPSCWSLWETKLL